MKKKVLILNEGEQSYAFSPTRGEYWKQLKHLEDQNYEIIQKNIRDPETEIPSILENLEDQSLAFLWPRMHGFPKSMIAYKGKEITSENLQIIFALLPEKLISNAIIFLESCSTGALEKDFHNNIQFTFAKLTLKLPNVQIIAPSIATTISRFEFNGEGFNCNMAPPYSSPKYGWDIAITLGARTKELIEKTELISKPYGNRSAVEMHELHSLLLDSLDRNTKYLPAASYPLDEKDVLGFEYDIMQMLHHSICTTRDLQIVKTLVEKYCIPLNQEGGWFQQPLAIALDNAGFLSKERVGNFHQKQQSLIDIIKYLISKGADPLLELNYFDGTNQILYKSAIEKKIPLEMAQALVDGLLQQQNMLDEVVTLDHTPLGIIKEYLFGNFFEEVQQYIKIQQAQAPVSTSVRISISEKEFLANLKNLTLKKKKLPDTEDSAISAQSEDISYAALDAVDAVDLVESVVPLGQSA